MRRRTSETNVPPYAFTSTADLKTAVQAYKNDPTAAVATYGPIADWDVSAITDMWGLFYKIDNFNANISNWDTSRVTDMNSMFRVRRPCPVLRLQSALSLHAACAAVACPINIPASHSRLAPRAHCMPSF